MSASKVYYASPRVSSRDSVPAKLARLMRAAGMENLDVDGKYVAIKAHFGEYGNVSYLKPAYARTIAYEVEKLGGMPFVTDCSTLYVGMRSNAVGHLKCAELNGFNSASCGCPIIIADGLRGDDEKTLPVPNPDGVETLLTEAYIGRTLLDADAMITLTHAKGCAATGFGGALKNIGMGGGSRAGKMVMHSEGAPAVNTEKCVGCGRCISTCGQDAIEMVDGLAFVNDKCAGCGHCISCCPCNAIVPKFGGSTNSLQMKIAEYAAAVVDAQKCFHVVIAADITPQCDCFTQSDAPVVPDVGMFASFDPVALDRAVADMICEQPVIPTSGLPAMREACTDKTTHLHALSPQSDWELCLEHAAALGAGSLEYELVEVS